MMHGQQNVNFWKCLYVRIAVDMDVLYNCDYVLGNDVICVCSCCSKDVAFQLPNWKATQNLNPGIPHANVLLIYGVWKAYSIAIKQNLIWIHAEHRRNYGVGYTKESYPTTFLQQRNFTQYIRYHFYNHETVAKEKDLKRCELTYCAVMVDDPCLHQVYVTYTIT
jgi:hypothetical protein